ncbi:putative HNH endonuclease family protein [Ralstonia phage RSK1]|uniref:Putative HNH endonuclease family protein n=1 Tax=Ralstonia phage RSK1 TaxID=1417599 RepID=U6C865_9CAUD|nr:HNH endonuclease [Ralstonia phage RSK1]BAO04697.1 putative HNH endonuclease family protein [Ralstonia phage RSK1]
MTPEREAQIPENCTYDIEVYKALAKCVRYEDGKLYWNESRGSAMKGKEAGSVHTQGYVRIPHHRKYVAAHRLIFFMHFGFLPCTVDHIDGNRSNNKIENLREATIRQNGMNRRLSRTNKTGLTGIYWHAQLQKWTASIRIDKKLKHLGVFDTVFDAACARLSAEKEQYGQFGARECN